MTHVVVCLFKCGVNVLCNQEYLSSTRQKMEYWSHLVFLTDAGFRRCFGLQREQSFEQSSRFGDLRCDVGVGMLSERLRVVHVGKHRDVLLVRCQRAVLGDVVGVQARHSRREVKRKCKETGSVENPDTVRWNGMPAFRPLRKTSLSLD